MKRRLILNRWVLVVAVCWPLSSPVLATGIPTLDVTNLAQNILVVKEAVEHTVNQVKQFETQLKQYEDQLRNSLAPAAYIWDQAQSTLDGLIGATNVLGYYKDLLGDFDSYITNFQDINYYKASPCFSASGCTQAQMAEINKGRELASTAQRKANVTFLKALGEQETALRLNTKTLEKLQSSAQGARGQMEALGIANQLAGHQAQQLLQIRRMLLVQHAALAPKIQADAAKEARQEAARSAALEQRIKKTDKPLNVFNLLRDLKRK